MSKTEGPRWEQLPECMTLFPLNHYISFCCLFQGPQTLSNVISGSGEMDRPDKHIATSASIQHATIIPSFILLISITKGLIMLMKRPNGLVLSVGDTAVGLGGKSCAKCVTQNQTAWPGLAASLFKARGAQTAAQLWPSGRGGRGRISVITHWPRQVAATQADTPLCLRDQRAIKLYAPTNRIVFYFKRSIESVLDLFFLVCCGCTCHRNAKHHPDTTA